MLFFSLLRGVKIVSWLASMLGRLSTAVHATSPDAFTAKKAMITSRENRGLRRLLERYDYTCGSMITPDGYCFFKLSLFSASDNSYL